MTTTNTVLASNQFYEIIRHTRILSLNQTEEQEYWLMDCSEELIYCFNTLEELKQYLKDNHITIAPKMGTVSKSVIQALTEKINEFNNKTHKAVIINIDTDQDNAVYASINWMGCAQLGADTALQYAEWLKEAAEYVQNFQYTGLTISYKEI